MGEEVHVFVSRGEEMPSAGLLHNRPGCVRYVVSRTDAVKGEHLFETLSLPRLPAYALKDVGGSLAWKRIGPSDRPPLVHDQIHIFQLGAGPEADEAADDHPPAVVAAESEASSSRWGSAKAISVTPSCLTNSTCIALQAMDEEGLLKLGESPQFLNFRPAYATPMLPAALAHPVFGNFLDLYEGRRGKLSRQDAEFFTKLAVTCCRFYATEAEYREKVARQWKDYLEFINDLECCRHPDNTGAIMSALETKLDMFGGRSIPGMQGSQYIRLYWLQVGKRSNFSNTCYPALVIEHVGPLLRASAVTVLNKLSFMPLTPFVNLLLLQGYALTAAERAACLCMAVKQSLQELSKFYQNPHREPAPQDMFSLGIPYPLHSLKAVPKQLVQGKLVYQHDSKTIFKYVQSLYGEEVHRAWAAVGLAPRLESVDALPGGWQQVRMEYLDSDWEMLQERPDAEVLRPAVLQALKDAHKVPVGPGGEVGVHGDARDVNVMVKLSAGEGRYEVQGQLRIDVKFIDFDWAGREGGRSYPYFMNHFEVNYKADDGEVMYQRHDRELLSKPQDLQVKVHKICGS